MNKRCSRLSQKKWSFWGLCGLSLLWGCGQNLTGTYTGTETLGFDSGGQASSSVTLSLTQVTNDSMTGTIQSTFGGGNITARPSGQMAIPYNLTASYAGTPTVTLSAASPLSCGTYSGKLNFTGNQVSGSLSLNAPAAVPSGLPVTSGGPVTRIQQVCPSTRNITATK